MKTWKLCLLALVPGVLGWLCNLSLSMLLTASLPTFLLSLLFYVAYYGPTVAAVAFCLWLGRRCRREQVSFPKYLLCTQWPSVVSLMLYIWQFLFVSDEGRSALLAALGQMPAVPLYSIASWAVVRFDTDHVIARPEMLAATVFSLVLLAALYIAGYRWKRRNQYIASGDVSRYTR